MDLIGTTFDQELLNIDITNYNDNFYMAELPSKSDSQNFSQVDDSDYVLETDKLYKIWLNKDPSLFLSKKNELRLEKLRNDNQGAQLSLVYSESLLSPETKKEANELADKYNINLVNFDEILKEAQNNPNFPKTELKLLMLVADEINHLGGKNNGGGNAASAADILRFCPSIAQFGIYSDFDVHLDFKNLTKSFGIFTPMIIPDNNNDFVAFAKGKDNQWIHHNALEEIYKIQNAILNNYKTYDSTDSEFVPESLFTSILFEKAQQEGKVFSIIEYRSQIEKIDIYDELKFIFQNNVAFGYIDPDKLIQNHGALESSNSLDKRNAEKLFCEIQDDYMHIIAGVHINLMPEGLQSIFVSIRNHIEDYEIENEYIKKSILNFETLDSGSMKKILSWLVRFRSDNLSDHAKNYYCSLASTINLSELKSALYQESVINISAPKVLDQLYSKGREKFSPEGNKMNGIIRTDGQDGSWYLGALPH